MMVELTESTVRVAKWVENHDFKGYEPFDGLSSWARPLFSRNLLGERVLQQLIRQSPINLRPIMGVKAQDSTKGRGYMAWGYLILYLINREEGYLSKAIRCLEWLDKHKAPKFVHHSWSNSFDFSSRGGRYTKDDPIIVWTSLIGQAYIEAFEITGENRWLEIADSACRWIVNLPRERTHRGDCLSYLAIQQSSIHNANMLGAALLARTGMHTHKAEYFKVAKSAMEYSCSRQLPDGAWWYAEEPKYHWIDNFHTGYNLDSLKHYIVSTGDPTWRENLRRGLEYYKAHFFEADGCPKYYNNRRYPIDSQCAGQSIDTLAFFSDEDPDCLALAQKVAHWTIQNMQEADGHFSYRIYPLLKVKTPMLHWAQATIFKGLANLQANIVQFSNEAEAAASQVYGGGKTRSQAGRTLRYVLVTPARNEEAYIEKTLTSVVSQTVLPTKWVIVSDGSTDRTDEIVKQYAALHTWIELLRMPERRDRQFAAKAHAFNAGCACLDGVEYDVIGNLDADISFDPTYFEFILAKFEMDVKLGVCGTPWCEDANDRGKHTYSHRFVQLEHVSGACQMFRKECFKEVGGYIPIKGGAIDWVAVTTARMKGWKTRTFLEETCFHHRQLGTGNHGPLMVRFKYGQKAYYMGGHPLWEFLRGLSLMRQAPLVLAGVYFLCGYFWAMLTRMKRPISAELIAFHRREQMARLRGLFVRSQARPSATSIDS